MAALRWIWTKLLAGLALFACSFSAVGAQTVVDGDIIRLGDKTWRIYGIDAPETRQWCDGYPAGLRAAETLEQLIDGSSVTCELRDVDRHGRSVGVCLADGQDIGEEMVRLGMAWAHVRFGLNYVEQEAQANADRLGVHGHDCEPAWEWQGTRPLK